MAEKNSELHNVYYVFFPAASLVQSRWKLIMKAVQQTPDPQSKYLDSDKTQNHPVMHTLPSNSCSSLQCNKIEDGKQKPGLEKNGHTMY